MRTQKFRLEVPSLPLLWLGMQKTQSDSEKMTEVESTHISLDEIRPTCGSTRVTQKFEPHVVSSGS